MFFQRDTYIIQVQLDNSNKYLFWIYDKYDEVLTNEEGRIITFSSLTSLNNFAKRKKILIKEEDPAVHNLDKLLLWINDLNSFINCKDTRDARNFFTDIAHTLRRPFLGDKKGRMRNNIYDKLFYGSNVFGMSPDGETFVPLWLEDEKKLLSDVLLNGINLFKNNIAEY